MDDFYQAVCDEHPKEAPRAGEVLARGLSTALQSGAHAPDRAAAAVLGELARGIPLGAALETALELPGVRAEELLG